MSHPDREESAEEDEKPPERDDEPELREADWTPPERSDQAPGEEAVQVNDKYRGGGPAPLDEAHRDDEQHPTGG
jgi:hypothetical protein